MSKFFCFLFLLFGLFSCKNVSINQTVITSDIDNFWEAYDKIITTKDSIQQYEYLNELYLDKASEGLNDLIEVRRYSDEDYIESINSFPKFWESIRANSLKAKTLQPAIEKNINKLKKAYPDLQMADIYFAIGAFRTNGTILEKNVLIGSEMALADESTDYNELPEYLHEFYATAEPFKNVGLLCTHEYVHTQQKELVDNLLSYCLYEGVAEFVSTKVTGTPSYTPAIEFGKANKEKVVKKFEEDVFKMKNTYNWLWGQNRNELEVRDLGYYIGYSICEKYYEMSNNKKKAIKEMIELDFNNETQIEAFIDTTKFLSASVETLYNTFESNRPTVIEIFPIQNQTEGVKPGKLQITLLFSKPMNPDARGFDYGPLGESNVLRVENVIGFSGDKKAFIFEVDLKPNQKYQSLVTNSFESEDGFPLKPFLIEFTTGVN